MTNGFRCSKGHEMEFSQSKGGHWYCAKCNKCTCGSHQGAGWDPKCRIPLHRQIFDRPMGMTD